VLHVGAVRQHKRLAAYRSQQRRHLSLLHRAQVRPNPTPSEGADHDPAPSHHLAAAATLAACNRTDDGRTVGQKVDGAVAKVEQKTEEAKADARVAGEKAKENTAGAMDTVAIKAKDAVITTSVNAELAKDSQLSALRINVDTVDGRVALKGTAPDTASRDRATSLARSVDGVKAVDNQLTVAPKG
jgi:hyperosmotically inducible periplasmic protein